MTTPDNSRQWRVTEWDGPAQGRYTFQVTAPYGQTYIVVTSDCVKFGMADSERILWDAEIWVNVRNAISRYVFARAFNRDQQTNPEPRVSGLECTSWWVDKDGDITFTVTWYGDSFAQVYLDPTGEWSHFAIDHTELTDVERQALKSVCAKHIIANAFGGKS